MRVAYIILFLVIIHIRPVWSQETTIDGSFQAPSGGTCTVLETRANILTQISSSELDVSCLYCITDNALIGGGNICQLAVSPNQLSSSATIDYSAPHSQLTIIYDIHTNAITYLHDLYENNYYSWNTINAAHNNGVINNADFRQNEIRDNVTITLSGAVGFIGQNVFDDNTQVSLTNFEGRFWGNHILQASILDLSNTVDFDFINNRVDNASNIDIKNLSIGSINYSNFRNGAYFRATTSRRLNVLNCNFNASYTYLQGNASYRIEESSFGSSASLFGYNSAVGTLNIAGSNFESDAVLQWNGALNFLGETNYSGVNFSSGAREYVYQSNGNNTRVSLSSNSYSYQYRNHANMQDTDLSGSSYLYQRDNSTFGTVRYLDMRSDAYVVIRNLSPSTNTIHIDAVDVSSFGRLYFLGGTGRIRRTVIEAGGTLRFATLNGTVLRGYLRQIYRNLATANYTNKSGSAQASDW